MLYLHLPAVIHLFILVTFLFDLTALLMLKTKNNCLLVSAYFYKMFKLVFLQWIVDIPIPSPCLPQPLPPPKKKNQCCSLDPQVFLLLQTTLIWGVRGFTVFKRNEIINELNLR